MATELRLRGARVWTADGDRPWAESITIIAGRVHEVNGATGPAHPGRRVIDVAGRTVIPGLIDTHMHLLEGGLTRSRVDLSDVCSRKAFESRIADAHRALPVGQWLIAQGWSNENWADHALPDKVWLAAAGERPVVCHRMDLHAVLVNDAVLRRCDTRADPPDGRIVRDEAGQPTGLLVEGAAWRLVNPLIPRPDAGARRAALLAAQACCQAVGLTTVGSMEYAREVEAVFQPCHSSLTLRCRITLLDRQWPLDLSFGLGFSSDDRLAVIGYKAFADGTLGSRTARLLEPYRDAPAERGTLVELAADGHLQAWARHVAGAGLQPAIHAIGDEAARLALDALQSLPGRVRPRIEHAQQLALADIPRFGGLVASMQPLHKADDGRYAEARLGRERLPGCFAFRKLLDAGAILAFGSDWPVVSCDPLAGLATAVTGRTRDGVVFVPEENLTIDEGLRAYTTSAAHALHLDDAGVLRPGSLGDLVVLDGDVFAQSCGSSFDPPPVALTVAGGEIVYDAGVM